VPHYVMRRPAFWLGSWSIGQRSNIDRGTKTSVVQFSLGPAASADRASPTSNQNSKEQVGCCHPSVGEKNPREWYPASAERADKTSPIPAAWIPVEMLTAPVEAQMIIPHLAGSRRHDCSRADVPSCFTLSRL
jgi:hypothetical protein